jgi:hypothetical protein
MKKLVIKPLMSVEESDKLEGKLLGEDSYKTLVDYDADVFDKDTGVCIAKFRRGVVPGDIQEAAFKSLLPAATPTDARGVATGIDEETGKAKHNRIMKNGKRDKVNRAHKLVNSGIIGHFERSQRFPYCRLTAFNKNQFEKFVEAYPIIKLVDNLYAKLMPKHYKKQRSLADKTSKDFVIPNTSFTTVTVNKNWQTAVHKDAGDFKAGFGNLLALRKGKFTGGYFVVPRWGVAFDMQNGDVLLVDVHQWHGNTPIKADPGAVRLSLVMYYREKMIHCGTMEEELKRVQKRKKGDKLI